MKSKLAVLLLAALFMCSGATCRNSGPTPTKEAVIFYSFKSTYDTAHEAYKQAQKLDLQGKLSPGKIEALNQKWNLFRASFRTAFVAASKDWSAATPQDVLKLRDDLLTFIRNL